MGPPATGNDGAWLLQTCTSAEPEICVATDCTLLLVSLSNVVPKADAVLVIVPDALGAIVPVMVKGTDALGDIEPMKHVTCCGDPRLQPGGAVSVTTAGVTTSVMGTPAAVERPLLVTVPE